MSATNINTGTGYAGAVNVPVAIDTVSAEQMQIIKVDVGGAGASVPLSSLVYTEDAVATANPIGLVPIMVADSTPGLEVADGDNVAQRATRYGAAYSQIVTSAGAFVDTFGGGTEYTEGATDASITGTAMMMEIAGNTLHPVQGAIANGSYGVITVTPGHISTANSTTAVLAGGATFTGTWEDTINYGVVQVSVIASHASASSGFVVQYSSDGTNVDNSDTYTISAGVGKLYSFQAGARYIRIVYTNGGTLQTSFRLQTIMKPVYAKPSSHRAGDQLSLEDDVEAVKSVIAGESTSGGGSLINVKVSPSGTLQTDAAVSAVVPGTGATNLGKAEDAAHTSGDVGVLGLAVRNDTGTQTTSANGDYTTLTTDAFNNLRVTDVLGGAGTVDTFGSLITGQRNNQIDIQFYRGAPSTLVTVSLVGTGTATQTSGGGVFAVGATTTSSAKGVTAATTYYTSGGEIYAQFTAAFPTAGAASSYQRIGLYDTNNGMFLGYEGASFGITTRSNTSDTTVAKASWNTDTLTGAVTSKFTRNGVPEAIDLTFANVFRVRFGWLGEAPIEWEVLSPDGKWVTFHIIKQPNTSSLPSILTPELPMTVDVAKTSTATNYSIITYCWGAGCTLQQRRASDSLTTASIMPFSRSIISGETTAGGGSLINVKVNPSGAVTVAGTTAIDQTTPGTTNAVVATGLAAHDAAISGNPVRVGFRALTSSLTAVAAGDTCDATCTVLGKQIVMPYALPGSSWRYVSPAGGIVSTTPITLVAAGGAGVKQYVSTISLTNSHQTIGTDIVIRNITTTATTLYRAWCQFAGGGVALNFSPPLASIANEGLEILEVTATGTAGVVATIDGYTAAE